MRLDNIVFRLGIAPTRRAARQLVSHKHILVNNKVCNIPSYSLKEGDLVSVRERSRSLESINSSLLLERNRLEWIEWNDESMIGKVVIAPERAQIPENIKEQLIVELYSK